MTKAYGWGVRVNRKEYFKLRLQNCSLINQNTMSPFLCTRPNIIVFYPHQPLFWTMKREGAGMHFIPFFEYAAILTLEIKKITLLFMIISDKLFYFS